MFKQMRTSLALVAIVALFSSTAFADWGWDGVEIPSLQEDSFNQYLDLAEDDHEGCWVVYTRHVGIQQMLIAQHFNEYGEKTYGPGLYLNSPASLYDQELIGLLPSEGDDAIAFYRSAGGQLPGGYSVFAQRLSRSEGCLWGDYGKPVIGFPEDQFGEEGLKCIATDGADGGWVLSDRMSDSNIYLNGINADGTLKFQEPLIIGEGEPGDVLNQSDIKPDGEGGVWISWEDAEGNFYVRNVSEDGSFSYDEPLYMNNPQVNTFVSEIVPIGVEQGAYWMLRAPTTTNSGIYWNIIRDNGELVYEEPVEQVYGYYLKHTDAVVLDDQSLSWCGVADYVDGPIQSARIDATGNFPYGEIAMDVETSYAYGVPTVNDNAAVLGPDSDLVYVAMMFYDEIHARMSIQAVCVDKQANDVWDNAVLYDNADAGPRRLTACSSSDGNMFVALNSQWEDARLFKVYQSSAVAGRDTLITDAPEVAPNVMPSEFKILEAYPNPFNSTIHVNFATPTPGQVQWRVVDVTGRVVANGDMEVSAGEHSLPWSPPSAISSGLLFLQMQQNAWSVTRKVMYVK